MKIGLVRHFKVTYRPDSKWMTSEQFNQWVDQYNKSDITPTIHSSNDLNWGVCLSSDLSRAIKTAEIMYQGNIIRTNQLREIGIRSVIQSRIKLHYSIWLFMGRVAWYFSHKSQEESRDETLLRARYVINRLETYEETNVLVVSHGAFMKSLSKELIRRGYKGKGFIKPRNGRLYTYERR
ncbi:histidine phosphatase family protein [Paenibacillus terrigena]|uniref:histidine phosphatase family protein n=1 Tax=Paenibacillus terrigena TaxID=369333 RepID=UPI00037ABDBE|nr:histidine phosphatase family protein [Paenibacillus terrigena]